MVNGVPMMNVPSNDAIILFGGGRHILLGLLQFGQNDKRIEDVELFILSTGILIWFNQLGNGIEIPFESVICHGSINIPHTAAADGHKLELLLTLERDKVLNQFFTGETASPELQEPVTSDGFSPTLSSIELTLRPKYSLYDRHCNPYIENLFTFDSFGVNRGDNMINNCNEALALCMEMYKNSDYDDDDEDDDDDDDDHQVIGDENNTEAMFTSINDTWNNYANSGLADDLEC